ncbi:MAG: hypothetical protein B5766_08215 [Candidatus Lumbricidophila eiseniae]|uniref:Uncharacterized protein n=1 Tax=Candidatus Lumbricidiphila eiseniae TaxID=1969409 RepID=A0A2A6FQ14_9MICO|nr:MAG: hypothetical protein B5766_08215 [Candidatus Lumbricidophila eiseniae]
MLYFDLPPTTTLTLLASTIAPLIIGLITTHLTHPGIKATLLAALTTTTALLTELTTALTTNTPYNLATALTTALTSFLIATGTHFGLWKPTGTANALQSIPMPWNTKTLHHTPKH